LLTEDTLYVLEDNYDGTYTTHFEIPCGHIKRIEKNKTEGINAVLATLIEVFDGEIKEASCNILTIVLHGKEGEHQRIYFGEISGNITKFVKAFDKLKSHKLKS